jgi:hypothetical protein
MGGEPEGLGHISAKTNFFFETRQISPGLACGTATETLVLLGLI